MKGLLALGLEVFEEQAWDVDELWLRGIGRRRFVCDLGEKVVVGG
jgi:hypothetical protein